MSALEDFFTGPYGWLSIFGVIIFFTSLTIIFYFRKDKYDPEPVSRIILAFVYGILSVIPALILSIVVALFLGAFVGSSEIVLSILVAPPVEEIVKGWFVIRLSKSDEFDGPLDGLIYGAMVGAGFAAAENLLYGVAALTSEQSLFAGLFVTTIRSLTQIIGHPFYTGLFGVGVGEAKVGLSTDKYNRIWHSIVLHALWNTAASLVDVLFLFGIVVMIGVSIYILRKELKRAIDLDRDAYERGYYEQKKRFLEEKKRRIKEQIRQGPQQWEQDRPPWERQQTQQWPQHGGPASRPWPEQTQERPPWERQKPVGQPKPEQTRPGSEFPPWERSQMDTQEQPMSKKDSTESDVPENEIPESDLARKQNQEEDEDH